MKLRKPDKNPITKRHAEVHSLKGAIELLLDAFKIKDKFNETNVLASWERIMGKTIANRTSKIYIHKKVLFITIDSAPLKNELIMSKSKILTLINNDIGENTIIDVAIR